MTRDDVKLLIKDLSMRLPYGVKFRYFYEFADGEGEDFDDELSELNAAEETVEGCDNIEQMSVTRIMPYLRKMSLVTEKEMKELEERLGHKYTFGLSETDSIIYMDWLCEHHFDYRGLIDKKLAIEAPEDMYY